MPVSVKLVFERIVIVHRVLLNIGKKGKITGKEKECKDKYTAVLHVRNLLCVSSK